MLDLSDLSGSDPEAPWRLAQHAAFVEWVLRPTPALHAQWDAWQQGDPLRSNAMAEARELVLALAADTEPLSLREASHLWQSIERTLQQQAISLSRTADAPTRPFASRQARWSQVARWAVAAVVVLGLGFGLWRVLLPNPEVEYRTAFGEMRNVRLPDGSTVVLQGNSTLRHARTWASDSPRVVQVEGLAYFQVATQRSTSGGKVPFRVHAGKLAIHVLGTQFQVETRGDEAEVLLTHGAIELTGPRLPRPIRMVPGDYAQIRPAGLAILESSRQSVQAALDSIAINRVELSTQAYVPVWLLDETPLSELATRIGTRFGVQPVFVTDSLRALTLSGKLPCGDLNSLATMISQALDIQVVVQGNTLLFAETLTTKSLNR